MAGKGEVVSLGTKGEFDACLRDAGKKLVVVDFTATWCGPCKKIAPEFANLAKEFPHATLCKVDVDANQETAAACGVKAMPTFQFYKNGEKVDEVRGADPAGLRAAIEKHAGEKWDAFQGAGQTLSGAGAAAPPPAAAAGAPTFVPVVDEALPTTTIQIRLHDGQKVQAKFNLSDKVASLYALAASATPGVAFVLANSYPRSKLEDQAQTIEDAKLQNASLTQSLS